MTIPPEAVRSLHTVPKEISSKLPRTMSIQGLLAAELLLCPEGLADWRSVVPKTGQFVESMPFMWQVILQELLPPQAKALLKKQKAMFATDWAMFQDGFGSKQEREYLYCWLLVNSRTFYFETPAMLEYPKQDRVALVTMADMFNHADTGCGVSFWTDGYTITTDRSYSVGEEVCTSYGEHTNDFLLAEYGFVLEENRWDQALLDDVIYPKLSPYQNSELEETGRLSHFQIADKSVTYNSTWVALRVLCCGVEGEEQWENYTDGKEDAESTLAKAFDMLPTLLYEYLGFINKRQAGIRALLVGLPPQRELLIRRWEQIKVIVKKAIIKDAESTGWEIVWKNDDNVFIMD